MTPFRLRRRSTPIIAILVATAGLAGVLTYQAWEAAHWQRATAINAVRDYAEFAAWEFSLAAKEELYQRLVAVFSPVRREKPLLRGAALASPGVLSSELADDLICPYKERFFFRVDFPARQIHINGDAPSAEMQRWIVDTIAVDVGAYKKDWVYSTVAGNIGGQPCSIVYQVKFDQDWRPAAAFGFQLCITKLADPSFVRTMKSHQLLPPSLTKNAPNDSLMSVILYDAAGHELWRTRHQFPLNHAGVAKVPYFGGLVTKVALNPRYTEALIIGGLPRSRLPLLFGVLALTSRSRSSASSSSAARTSSRGCAPTSSRASRTSCARRSRRSACSPRRSCSAACARTRSGSGRSQIVDQEARRLTHLVENILQFSRAERHAITLAPIDAALAPQISAALESIRSASPARGRSDVATSLDEGLRGIAGRPSALRQILLNLLDNAVKYGPASARRCGSARAVGDPPRRPHHRGGPGPGIPPDAIASKVWEPFYRLDRDAQSAVAGSGIGLERRARARAQHGGDATGRGLRRRRRRAVRRSSFRCARSGRVRARILVVEDNADLAFGLRNNLEIEGYEVDGRGRRRARDSRARSTRTPDLVVLDLMLPEMDGYRVLRELRQRGFDEPVLILTARGEEADKVHGLPASAPTTTSRSPSACSSCSRGSTRCCAARRGCDARHGRHHVTRFGDVEVDRVARIVARGRDE